MKFSPFPVVGGSYADQTLSWSAQDCLNYLPSNAEAEGAKTPSMLKTPPGLKPFAELVSGGGSNPVRGMTNAEGKVFVVIGTTMYQLSQSGVFIPLGTIPGTGRVIFSHNQVSLGNQVLAVNGSAGYIYDTRDQTFQRITDPGYPGAFVATFIDGYFVQISANRRFAFNSDVANGLEYNTLDRFTSEFSPDLLVSLVASNNELFLLSETSGEFFENTGAAQQPFRSKRITMDRGCAGAYTVAKADNTVFWLGNNGYFYVLNGYAPQRISTRAIEQSILGLNWKQAFAFSWEDAGHTVIYWTFPDGLTWGYDTSTGLWHRRASYGLNRWRASTMTFWNQEWYAGDFQYGRVWKMDWNYILEGDQEFISERTTAVMHDNQNRVIIPRMELLMQVGQEETIPVDFSEQPDGPTITGDAPNWGITSPYSFAYTVTPGTAPVVGVTLRSGALPPGLSLSSAGVLTGTPTTPGTYAFELRVTDTNSLYDDLADTILIALPMLLIADTNVGTVVHAIPSYDGIDWSATPIASSGSEPNVQYSLLLASLPGRYWGKGIGAATPAAYSDDLGFTWTATAGNVVRGPGDAYTNGKLFLGAYGGNYLVSADNGETFSSGVNAAVRIVTLGRHSGKLAGIIGNNITESVDTGATWSAGVAHGLTLGSGGCEGTDGTYYYFGGSTSPTSGTPKLVRCILGSITNITMPAFSSAIAATAFTYGNNIKVVGTTSGELAFDNGSGFQLSATAFAGPVIQLFWNGAVFVALEGGNSPGDNGAVYYSYDGDTFTAAPTYAPLLPYSVAQAMTV